MLCGTQCGVQWLSQKGACPARVLYYISPNVLYATGLDAYV